MVIYRAPAPGKPLSVWPSQRGRTTGERNHWAKLTAETVRAARLRFAAGVSVAALAREHGVAEKTLRNAVHRLTWRHVE